MLDQSGLDLLFNAARSQNGWQGKSVSEAQLAQLAARAIGLDCGPMSGFNSENVERALFPDGGVKVNFLCGISYGDSAKVFPRSRRV